MKATEGGMECEKDKYCRRLMWTNNRRQKRAKTAAEPAKMSRSQTENICFTSLKQRRVKTLKLMESHTPEVPDQQKRIKLMSLTN